MIMSYLKLGKVDPQQSLNRVQTVDLAAKMQGELMHPQQKMFAMQFPRSGIDVSNSASPAHMRNIATIADATKVSFSNVFAAKMALPSMTSSE